MPRLTAGLRVLITADCVGGVWRYVMDVSRELAGRGASVAVACLGPAPTWAQCEEARRIGVELFPLDAALDWTANDPDALRDSGRLVSDLARRWAPTVLHLNAPALAACVHSAVPRVVAHSCVATWWSSVKKTSLPPQWRWYASAARAGLSSADIVVAPTRAFARTLAATYGPIPQLVVIGNGSGPVPTAPKERFALAVGRWWDEAKNALVVDEAAAIADCPVYVAGAVQGPADSPVRFRHARWLGELPHDEMKDWYARAAVFVSPAVYEPFGLAALEAAGAGAALALSAIPTFIELWNGCATFAPATDPAAFAARIDLLADDEEVRHGLVLAARTRAENRTVPRQVDALIGAYAMAAAARSRAA